MKKRKQCIGLGILCFSLLGCGGEEATQTKVCSGELMEGIQVRNEIVYDEDNKGMEMTYANKIDYAAIGLSKEEIEQVAKETDEDYGEVEGVSYRYTFEEDLFVEETYIDLKKADMDGLKELGLVNREALFIDAEATIDNWENEGFDCE